jgi:hypothetical protein
VQRAGYTATTRLLINAGCLHVVRVEHDAVRDQGGGASVEVEKTNQELLCKYRTVFKDDNKTNLVVV